MDWARRTYQRPSTVSKIFVCALANRSICGRIHIKPETNYHTYPDISMGWRIAGASGICILVPGASDIRVLFVDCDLEVLEVTVQFVGH